MQLRDHHGPAVLAPGYLHRHERGKQYRGSDPQRLVVMIACLLEGDAPVRFDFTVQVQELATRGEAAGPDGVARRA